MKKFYNWIINIPKDKLLHVDIEMLITLVSIVIFKLFGCGLESCAYGWLVGFLFGIGKEIYDEIKYKSSTSSDWFADVISCTFISICALLLLL